MGAIFNTVQDTSRTVHFSRSANKSKFCGNQISTTKYNIITFIPKALLLQFLRPANWVYLITAVAQSIPEISSLSPITAIAPLTFVLGVSLLKEGIQDYKRYKKDKQINQQQICILKDKQWVTIIWADIEVGDIVRVKEDGMIPADLLLLHSTEENSICYVMTANLDGENNLKTKNACESIRLFPEQLQAIKGSIIIENPNSNLHEFHGLVKIKGKQQKQVSLDNLLVRGSMIKNTDCVVGVVIYAGHDTKIMQNQGIIQHKVSHVENRVNRIQLFLALLLIILSVGSAIGYYRTHTAFATASRRDFPYLSRGGFKKSMVYESLLILFTNFLLLSFIIPISMNVALEGIKIFQGFFLGWDKKMFYKPLKQYCNALNLSIIEELGQIDYVLTDKTGTLTSNEMRFQNAFIEGNDYQAEELLEEFQEYRILKRGGMDFAAFWLAVVICHDVVVDTKKAQFQGSSPDEVCFVEYAAKIGYKFIKRTKNSLELQINGEKLVYEYIHTIPFSPRKRMSVIVRDLSSGQILLYTKGADSAIFQKSDEQPGKTQFKVYEKHLTAFSSLGLRTLVFSMRQMPEKQLKAYLKEISEIKTMKLKGVTSNITRKQSSSMDKGIKELSHSQDVLMSSQIRNPQDIEKLSEALIQSTETNLEVLGISAIQDRLQDFVPQTIARLQEAGIVVMMITGDKLETAENIGYLSNFIRKDATVYRLRSGTESLEKEISATLKNIKENQTQHFSVIIEGDSISKYMKLEDLEAPIELLRKCKSVIFCRSTPKEKALIVTFVKEKLTGIVLAIGDGGNDIGMIQEANIGVGIIGKQGNQAASSSDFHFAQFRFLDRLVLHHGRWTYYRMSYFFVYYGWKNLYLTLLFFWFMANSAFSGFPALSEPFITIYNTIIALILVTYYTVLQQDINQDDYPESYDKMPIFYKEFKQMDLFSYKRYLLWSVLAVALSLLSHFSFKYCLGSMDIIDSAGHTADFNTYASGISIALSIAVLFVIIADMNHFTWFSFWIVLVFLSIVPPIGFFMLENFMQLSSPNIAYALTNNFTSFRYIATIWLTISLTILGKFGYNQALFLFWPTQTEKCMKERQRVKDRQEKQYNVYPQISLKETPQKMKKQQKQ